MNFKFSEMSFKGIGKTLLGWFGIAVIAFAFICGTVFGFLSLTEENYSYSIFRSKAELSYYAVKDDLIKSIDEFIHTNAESSALNGFALLEGCDEYNVDVRFALAQGLVESHYGTEGIAAKTHGVFNVKAYDGRSAKDMLKKGDGYKHPDKSIKPYLELLTSRYLVGGKTEMDLLDKFVDGSGHRYASSTSYEASLRAAYNRILDETNISALYADYQKYKMICGK